MIWFLTLLYALVVPYIGLMLLVVAGMVRHPQEGAPLGSAPSSAPRPDRHPPISVILPAHNEAKRLAGTLASLAQQRYPGPCEFIIVDDRSSDGTAAIIRSFVERDPRFRLVAVREPSRRLSPKVNAVATGIQHANGEIIVTTDADCRYPPGWLQAMTRPFANDDVVMVVGYVETTRPFAARNALERFETIDWLSLMLTSRSLLRFGLAFASSANNQAYRRSAFDAVGGFGAGGRAPSGDEDLLTQRLGRLGGRIVFADEPAARLRTQPEPSLRALLRQRRRWVSRYHYPLFYRPAFWLGIAVLGFQSIALSLAILLLPLLPQMTPWVLGLWAAKLTVEGVGMWIGTGQLQRRDLWGAPVAMWALLHPFFIATIVLWSFVRPGSWQGGQQQSQWLRRSPWRRQLRSLKRRLRSGALDSSS